MLAYYFGSVKNDGHYLFDENLNVVEHRMADLGIPWTIGLMDTGLLKNNHIPDNVTGKVFCDFRPHQWFGFVWWDRSGDSRPNSNSGFYVKRYKPSTTEQMAFDYACGKFPHIIARQKIPLVLQGHIT